jgi:putative FmdB family regulatory protein
MPTYEYECSQCGKLFEHFQSMKSDPLTDCPDETCGGKGTVKRLISAGGGLIFKGTGFYVTDYKKSHTSGTPSKSNGKKADSESGPSCACSKAGSGECPMTKESS